HFFVDLPESYTRLNYGASGEQMIVCTITQTLLGVPGARDVTFLVGGRNAETLLGHFDLSVPYTKDDCKL
ncbi:GerMN domain-containing protein, partial [Deinococcus pimensis]|uniref:GerMN domain-containing protein n=1 Tax=Deinococcus pimensis TaxID=309888 RepID=UPI0005EBBA3C